MVRLAMLHDLEAVVVLRSGKKEEGSGSEDVTLDCN